MYMTITIGWLELAYNRFANFQQMLSIECLDAKARH